MEMYTLAVSTFLEAGMKEIQKAKFFKTGGSRALRIPARIFSGTDEVWMKWDEDNQVLMITGHNPKPFEEFFRLAQRLGQVDIPPFIREPETSSRPSFEERMRLSDNQ